MVNYTHNLPHQSCDKKVMKYFIISKLHWNVTIYKPFQPIIVILNIYNPLNNIKFTNEKKIYSVLDFLKVKYHTKTKKEKR